MTLWRVHPTWIIVFVLPLTVAGAQAQADGEYNISFLFDLSLYFQSKQSRPSLGVKVTLGSDRGHWGRPTCARNDVWNKLKSGT